MTENGSKMMSIRQFARTGMLTEHALRLLVKQGKIPVVFIGTKALLDYDLVTETIRKIAERNLTFQQWD